MKALLIAVVLILQMSMASECNVPENPVVQNDVFPSCPNDSNCSNIPGGDSFSTLEAAWNKCSTITACTRVSFFNIPEQAHAIYSSRRKFFIRRDTDPVWPMVGAKNYVHHCEEEHPYYEFMGNGHCLNNVGKNHGVPLAGTWPTVDISDDGTASYCEDLCNADIYCIGYMVKYNKQCQIIPGNKNYAPSYSIGAVNADRNKRCYRKAGGPNEYGIWTDMKFEQCVVTTVSNTLDDKNNPLFRTSVIDGKRPATDFLEYDVTLEKCRQICLNRKIIDSVSGRFCIGIKWESNNDSGQRAKCQLVWGCDSTRSWNEGRTQLLRGVQPGRLMNIKAVDGNNGKNFYFDTSIYLSLFPYYGTHRVAYQYRSGKVIWSGNVRTWSNGSGRKHPKSLQKEDDWRVGDYISLGSYVTVRQTKHPNRENDGRYFYSYDNTEFDSAFPSDGNVFAIQYRGGDVIRRGKVKVWKSGDGVHGRREPGKITNDGDWKMGDLFENAICPNRYTPINRDLDGTGKVTEGNLSAIDKCSEACDNRNGCTGFEYKYGSICRTYTGGNANIGDHDGRLQTNSDWASCIKVGVYFAVNSVYKSAAETDGRYFMFSTTDYENAMSGFNKKYVKQYRGGKLIWSGRVRAYSAHGGYGRKEPFEDLDSGDWRVGDLIVEGQYVDDACPSEYTPIENNLDGTGKTWHDKGNTRNECGTICDDRAGCTGFEYRASDGSCGTYTGGNSNVRGNEDRLSPLSEWLSCAVMDECGVANGDNSSCADDCGVANGDNSSCADDCGVANGDNSSCADECGVANGDNSSCADDCGVANGDNSSCADDCGVANGDNSSCADDCGVANGDNSSCADDCGVANGDNSSCTPGCVPVLSVAYSVHYPETKKADFLSAGFTADQLDHTDKFTVNVYRNGALLYGDFEMQIFNNLGSYSSGCDRHGRYSTYAEREDYTFQVGDELCTISEASISSELVITEEETQQLAKNFMIHSLLPVMVFMGAAVVIGKYIFGAQNKDIDEYTTLLAEEI